MLSGGGFRRVRPHPGDRGLHSRSVRRRRAGAGPGRGRHSRQARADRPGVPRVALVERADEKLEGRILGTGADAGERSTVQGEIRYRIVSGEAPGTARVELAIGYALKGAFAQFARPALVRNFAGRMIAEFSRNLEAGLAGRSSEAPPSEINLPRLLLSSLTARFVRWAKGLLGRLRPAGGGG